VGEFAQERIEHLKMIQDVITRMAGESAKMKQYALVALGVLASTAQATGSVSLALVAAVMAVVFWLLDARYLAQERWYRTLYDKVRAEVGPTDFCLSPGKEIRSGMTIVTAARGWSVAPLYGTLTVIALLLVWITGTATSS